MDYLFYCRDRPGMEVSLERLTEAHWSFMDNYADRLLVRGPTLSEDGEQHTGSLHIVSLASIAETERFAYQEPFYQAGVYGEVVVRSWRNLLGRTMRDFHPTSQDPLFLLLAHARPDRGDIDDLGAAQRAFATKHGARLGAYGSMSSIDDAQRQGIMAVIQAPSRAEAAAVAAAEPATAAATVEIHRWCVGGRR